jgi:hypothetical protein
MVVAAYPNASEDEMPYLMGRTITGFQLGTQLANVDGWSLVDINDFITLYQDEFQQNGDSIVHYVMVTELLAHIAQRVSEVSPSIPEELPFWFKTMHLKKAYAAAA